MLHGLGPFLTQLEKTYPDQLTRVDETVSHEYELSAIAFEYIKRKNSCLLFERIKGFDMPLVTNVFGSKDRMALALGVPADGLYERVSSRIAGKVNPVMVDGGPVKEVKIEGANVDLEKLFPVPRWFEQDAGRYVTAGLVVAKNLEKTVINLMLARMQLKGKNKFGISLHSRGHQYMNLQRAKEAGKPLEVAVVIGAHPALYLAAASQIDDEYSAVGSLVGEPIELTKCETVDLEVPSEAEVVLEGEISTTLEEDEGPFSEYTGYASAGRSTRNVLFVNAVTHRRKPVFQSILPSSSPEHIMLGSVTRYAKYLELIKSALPTARVKAANWPLAAAQFASFIALEKPIPGVAKRLALLIAGVDYWAKLIVITDETVDVTDFEQVLTALAKHVHHNGRSDLDIVDKVLFSPLDPSSKEGMQSKMLVDATPKKEPSLAGGKAPEKEALERLKRGRSIMGVRFPAKCEGLVAYLKAESGDPKQLASVIYESYPSCRVIIIVDPDIDLEYSEEVLWAVATHLVPKDDVLLVTEHRDMPRIILDTRKGEGWTAMRSTLPALYKQRATTLLAKYFR